MPNYVKNVISFPATVPEEAFQELLSAVRSQPQVKEGATCFDFNSLVPMPESLMVESGSSSDSALYLIQVRDLWTPALAAHIMSSDYRSTFRGGSTEAVQQDYQAIKSLMLPDAFPDDAVAGEVVERLDAWYQDALDAVPFVGTAGFFDEIYKEVGRYHYKSNHLKDSMQRAGIDPLTYDAMRKYCETESGAKEFALGEKLANNIKLYNAPTWYEWAIQNWGTKWNACDPEVDAEARTITFDTAWSAPVAIANALAARFPGISWKWLYADEDRGANAGTITCEDGTVSIDCADCCSSEAFGIYVECWGETECLFCDEEGVWQSYSCDESCPNYKACYGIAENKEDCA